MTPALLHPFAAPARERFVPIVRGEGALVWDADGNEYVDGMANLWLCQVGHGRREIVDAVARQMTDIAGYNTFDPFTNPAADELAEWLCARASIESARVFLACSGSEAVDTAIKLARLYHQRRGESDRQVIIRRRHGYHGTNLGGTSVQGIESNRSGWGDLLPHVVEIAHDDIEDAARVFAEYGTRCAAVISEPVQGAGGVNVPPDGYLEGLRRLCDRYGALLIADEVICGFGRTGNWFGSDTYAVRPDLITFAKGASSGYLPLAGVIIDRAVTAEWEEDETFVLRHGYTFSGHPASCAAALANLRIIEREGLVDRAHHIGQVVRTALSALADDGVIAGYRGIGALWAADLGRDAAPLKSALIERGAIMRPIGTSIVICPPLVITDEQIWRLTDAIADVSTSSVDVAAEQGTSR